MIFGVIFCTLIIIRFVFQLIIELVIVLLPTGNIILAKGRLLFRNKFNQLFKKVALILIVPTGGVLVRV